ncbi:amyloid-beta A4 precursor protein-binding family A member 3 isoform X2 [Gouania willdenowi]|uniref:Amyloid-beta A4 precursor protein-binding family A member 3 n=1 Tax=Gouania willdenowi TaxID=441366 RepID=A0A8C5D6T0_GOUWI|nr:amyloid-beta A4 precursor protein-binding family A member 3-like isoform X2 [Gouania willdenowi]
MDPDCPPAPAAAAAAHAHTDTVLSDSASAAELSILPTPETPTFSKAEELDSYNLIEPPPLDWRSDSSSEAVDDLDESSFPPSAETLDEASVDDHFAQRHSDERDNSTVVDVKQQEPDGSDADSNPEQIQEVEEGTMGVKDLDGDEVENEEAVTFQESESRGNQDCESADVSSGDEDHGRIHTLLSQLQLMREPPPRRPLQHYTCRSELEASEESTETTGLLFSENHQRDLQQMLECTEISTTAAEPHAGTMDAVVSVSYSQEDAQRFWRNHRYRQQHRENSVSSTPEDECPEPVWMKMGEEPPEEEAAAECESSDDQPSYKDVPGPCDPEDLLEGVIFGAKYLGSTQIKSDKHPSTNARMAQAQEAVDRIKAPEGETQPMTEVDLFISTQRIKVLTADTQEAMMDHALQMISYIADIGKIVVLMARRKRKGQDTDPLSSPALQKKCTMICHVFSSEDAQIIAQAIGQAFGVAYQQFLSANGIKASDLRPGEYSDYLESQELYNGDLAHFSDSQNLRDVAITKPPGEILGLAVVESGWGSILPTVVVANLLHGGPAERSGELSIGDRIMSVNGTSLVGLPITTCQNIIRICSLMRGGIAERGGIRVGHRIIEINGQSVVATPHDKIIQTLTNAIGEIHLKTMPASTYRLLTGQEQPVFL